MAEEYIKGMTQLRARLRAVGATATHTKILTAGAGAVIREQKLLAKRFRRSAFLESHIVITNASPTSVTIASLAPYSRFVEEGTGLYGPKHAKITPKAATVLRWMGGTYGPGGSLRLTGERRKGKAGAAAGWVFAMSVKGRPATPYFYPGAKLGIQKTGGLMATEVVNAWNDAA